MTAVNPFSRLIFCSRWLQLPLYIGLILAQCVYTFRFLVQVYQLIAHDAMQPENAMMMTIIGLIDTIMVSNLVIVVAIGGYETFVSKLRIEGHPDRPEWLSKASASELKIKLALSLITISSIHLLETFLNIDQQSEQETRWQIIIHFAFIASALSMALIDRLSPHHAARSASAMRRKTDQ